MGVTGWARSKQWSPPLTRECLKSWNGGEQGSEGGVGPRAEEVQPEQLLSAEQDESDDRCLILLPPQCSRGCRTGGGRAGAWKA